MHFATPTKAKTTKKLQLSYRHWCKDIFPDVFGVPCCVRPQFQLVVIPLVVSVVHYCSHGYICHIISRHHVIIRCYRVAFDTPTARVAMDNGYTRIPASVIIFRLKKLILQDTVFCGNRAAERKSVDNGKGSGLSTCKIKFSGRYLQARSI